ncbi:biotin--[acetyl-CoA-carboxylase] ligase [Synechococcus sp. M16CYN]
MILSHWLQGMSEPQQPCAIVATHQRWGVGQWGRNWSSPTGGVWISAALPWQGKVLGGRVGLLGLAVAVALAERLERHGLPVQIKWPNDILLHGRKLVGLLPSVIQRGSRVRIFRIGLGLNVRNSVPMKGIALYQLDRQRAADPAYWTAEVLLAFDRCYQSGGDGSWCLSALQRRLWANKIYHPRDGRIWRISGLAADGALQLQHGNHTEQWHHLYS